MNNVIDIIPSGELEIPVVTAEELPIDLLNRQDIIDQIMQLLTIISDSHSSCAVALNGAWGSGKTFVLNRLMKQLLDYQDGEKFLVFHYNCWQYDYYEEPLIAIVAAMLDSADQETHLFSQSLRRKAKEGLTLAKPILEKVAKEFIQKKIGVDITSLISFVKDGSDALAAIEERATAEREYNEYYAFKKAISAAQDSIRSLAQDRTVVVIIDELDRCLPDYAIRVMERLHHLFSGVNNCVTIMGVDKEQLTQTIKQIFGADTDTANYLKKFIDYEIQLDIGKVGSGFREKYSDYCDMFDDSIIETSFSLDEYTSALFDGVSIRAQEHMLERIKTVHKILFPDSKKDASFMWFELMWITFCESLPTSTSMPIDYEPYEFTMRKQEMPGFSQYIKNEWQGLRIRPGHFWRDEKPTYVFSSPVDIPQLLIWYLWQMYESTHTVFQLESGDEHFDMFKQNLADFKKVDQLLKIIK